MKKPISLLLLLLASIIIPVFSQPKSPDSIGKNLQDHKELVQEIPKLLKKKDTFPDSSHFVITMNPEIENFLNSDRIQISTFIIIGLALIAGTVIIYLYNRRQKNKLTKSS